MAKSTAWDGVELRSPFLMMLGAIGIVHYTYVKYGTAFAPAILASMLRRDEK